LVEKPERKRLEFVPAMKIQVLILWVMTSCNYDGYLAASVFMLEMEAARSSEMLLSFHIITLCHIPEDHDVKGRDLSEDLVVDGRINLRIDL
jgi:hypothetical protein